MEDDSFMFWKWQLDICNRISNWQVLNEKCSMKIFEVVVVGELVMYLNPSVHALCLW